MLKIGKDETKCSGCRICELVCALKNTGECNPKKSFIKITANFPEPGYHIKMKGCKLCGECLKYCPTKALFIKEGEGEKIETAVVLKKESSLPGYGGKILRVDLSTGEIKTEDLEPEFARNYLGGRGFAAKLLYDLVKKGTDPLGPENKVIMAAGPLSGALVLANSKTTFASKSPLTGGYGDSNVGGHLAAEMKYAGYDAVVIGGKAEKPSYLFIDGDKVEIRDAEKYWGKGSMEAEKMLKSDLGKEFQIAVIGPAGENQVYFACISHDFGRQAGRTGIGAVLGSKNLKAVAIRGDKPVILADQKAMVRKTKETLEWCMKQPDLETWQKYGTPSVTVWANEIGALPYKNFQSEHMEDVSGLKETVMREKIVVHDKACMLCPMACGKYSHSKKEGKYDVLVEGPEYETIALCGSNCGFNDIQDVAYNNYLCDELGIDTISAGGVIAFAIECFEKSIITKEDTEGRELKFGDVETFEYLARKIAKKQGVGKVLADGVRLASQRFGKGSQDFAIHVKGLEWSGYGSRNALAMLLSYLTCDVGGHHNRSWAITSDIEMGRELLKGKPERVIFLQHARPMFDMLGACRLLWVELKLKLDYYTEMLKVVTDLDYTLEDIYKISERVWNLTRAFSIREIEGFGRAYDTPPARFLKEAVPSGPTKGKKLSMRKINKLLNKYYKLRGWTKSGIPTKKKLKELELEFVIPDLFPGKK